MEFAKLSNEEHIANPRSGRSNAAPSIAAADLQETVRNLQQHRAQLEMQNRALRETQSALEDSVRRYADLYDHLPIGYITLTPEGKILHSNRTAASWLRQAPDQLIGGYLNWYLDAFDGGRFAAHLENCTHSENESQIDVTLRLDHGIHLTVQLTSRLAPPDVDGQQYIHTAITNITKLKQVQAVMEDIQREQEAFTESISHDLRAPLVTISSFARILLEEHGTTLTPEVRNLIERMDCAAVRMEATLRSLLDFCSIGSEVACLDPVNLEELAQQAVVELRSLITDTHADVQISRPLPCVRGSRLILAQVLSHVIASSLKGAAPGYTPRLTISAAKQQDRVVLMVSSEVQGVVSSSGSCNFRLFERLHDNAGSLTSGLGIAIIRRAIERINGRLSVNAPSGSIACFNFELPGV